MISKNKTYRTRDGREVRIYATDHPDPYPVIGAVKYGEQWITHHWFEEGSSSEGRNHIADLIEVKPRIQREYWVNVYEQGVLGILRDTKEEADEDREEYAKACVKVTIDCEEGEGL